VPRWKDILIMWERAGSLRLFEPAQKGSQISECADQFPREG